MGQGIVSPSYFFVDTSILIAHGRQKSPTILHKASHVYGTAVASEIVLYELEVGARRAGRQYEFQSLFPYIRTYPISNDILIETAKIQADLLKRNQTIGLEDTIIAATSIYHNIPLFTLNTKHFQRVNGLTLLPMP